MSLKSDLRYATRLLGRQRSASVLVLLTLTLGIAATSAMFSVMYGVLLRPLPFAQPDRIVSVAWAAADPGLAWASANYLDLARENVAFSYVAAYNRIVVDLADGAGDPERVGGADVTEDYFAVFGVRALHGRTFSSQTAAGERGRAAVVSHGFWRRRFGGSTEAIGRDVRINGTTRTIVGVMPDGFAWPTDTDVWLLAARDVPASPLDIGEDARGSRQLAYLSVVARTKADLTLAQAREAISEFGRTLAARLPAEDRNRTIALVPLQELLVGDLRPVLLLLMGAAASVLLIACANVANVQLAAAIDRRREITLRVALGAGRVRIVRQLLVESLVLSMLGGAFGLLGGRWITSLLIAIAPEDVPRLDEVALDWTALGFTFVVCVATGVAFGLAPALQALRVNPSEALHEASTRAGSSPGTRLLRSTLVVSQVALAMMLLAVATLMVTSLVRLRAVDPGFRVDQVMAAQVSLPIVRYSTQQAQVQFYSNLLDRLQSTGIARAQTLAFPAPLSGSGGSASFEVEGSPSDGEQPRSAFTSISSGYFQTLGVAFLSGRDFTDRDGTDASRVAIVNAAFARKYWPNEDPVGRRLVFDRTRGLSLTVVGVVADVKGAGLEQMAPPMLYLPYRQLTVPYMTALLRTTASPAQVATRLRAIVRELDPELPVDSVEPLAQNIDNSIAQPRFRATLLVTFAVAALLLAIVGVYGVLSYLVAQRRREIGVRAALGAQPVELMRMVMRQGLQLAAVGIVVGIAGSLMLRSVLAGLLFGVAADDPRLLSGAALTLGFVALLACAVPAWRSMRIDPLTVLREP